MLSVMIGVVAALVIVAIIVIVVLRLQHSHVDDQGKSHVEDHDKASKSIPIQRELRFREGSNVITDEKYPTSPFRKLDPGGDVSESDEKNPDIIPQQITGACVASKYFFRTQNCDKSGFRRNFLIIFR